MWQLQKSLERAFVNADLADDADLILAWRLESAATSGMLCSMGKGHEENQARLALLSSFGKELARRAKSTCELSGKSGVPLRIYEVPPAPKEPNSERCLMLCDEVIEALAKPSLFVADEWRHLGELIWTDQTMVQLMTVRILQYLGKENPWCQEIIEEAYLDDEVLEEAEKGAF